MTRARQGLLAQGPAPHHGDIGPVLVELHLVPLPGGAPDDEGEQPEVALRVAGHQVVPLEVERGQVPVVILDPFAHQVHTRLGVEGVLLPGRLGLTLARLVVLQQRFLPLGPAPVGPAGEFHLDQPEVDPHLDLVPPVVAGHDPRDADAAIMTIRTNANKGEVATGLLYVNETQQDMHDILATDARPLNAVPMAELCPGSKALEGINARLR